ncbi:MAG: hypothetical protein Q8927_09200 [Bacteroidota bacterium]|nr:hypothetical protein [Bacteroidota bacterium]
MNPKSANPGPVPVDYYERKIQQIASSRQIAVKRRSILSFVRLGTMAIAIVAGYVAWHQQDAIWLVLLVAGLAAFGRALFLDTDNNARIRRLEGLDELVRYEQLALAGQAGPAGRGAQSGYAGAGQADQVGPADPAEHPYSYDLDIFGKGSVFAMLNRSQSEPGRDLLASWLMTPADRGSIRERQEAIKELAGDPDRLFDLAVIGRQRPLRNRTVQHILHWLKKEEAPFSESYWALVRWGYPVVTLGLLACYIAGLIGGNEFGFFCLLFLGISSYFSKTVIAHYVALSGIVKEVGVLSEGIGQIEERTFHAGLNKRLQGSLLHPHQASKEIKGLDGLLHRFDYRLNPYVFIPLNAFLLWDLWQMHGLNTWRQRNRERIGQWTQTLAGMEALGSMALLYFNHPDWCFPEIVEGTFEFGAQGLGHPLIPERKRVTNDFAISGTGRLELVTGSNMAGKSTWLRTVGVNMVLAMAGSPVCARSCRLSVVSVVSSMRVADNLEDSTSTFYAELKKLRSIIEKVKHHEPVFILLDEILRGTNSRDRLAGSRALIRQLIREGAVGIIATHDLELAQMEEELPGHIYNYYFDVQFFGEELGFDYTLRNGICTTKNAELLMKQIGIELA